MLGECLLISSLPGMASRMLVDVERLVEPFNILSKPSLVNLISKDSNLVFYLSDSQDDSLFKLANMKLCSIFCVYSASLATSFKSETSS